VATDERFDSGRLGPDPKQRRQPLGFDSIVASSTDDLAVTLSMGSGKPLGARTVFIGGELGISS